MRFTAQSMIEYSIQFVGSPDLPMVWSLQREWYLKHCPEVTFKELAREGYNAKPTSVDRLWNEPNCGTLFFDPVWARRIVDVFNMGFFSRSFINRPSIHKIKFRQI